MDKRDIYSISITETCSRINLFFEEFFEFFGEGEWPLALGSGETFRTERKCCCAMLIGIRQHSGEVFRIKISQNIGNVLELCFSQYIVQKEVAFQLHSCHGARVFRNLLF